jgi:hypothetical protein
MNDTYNAPPRLMLVNVLLTAITLAIAFIASSSGQSIDVATQSHLRGAQENKPTGKIDVRQRPVHFQCVDNVHHTLTAKFIV